MRTFHRLNRVDRDDVNRPGRETTEAILEREARLRHIERLYLVRHINNGRGRKHGQNSALYRRCVIILFPPIAC